MPDLIKDFFSWSKKERIGVIALSAILLALFFLNFFFDRWFTPELENWNADSLAFYSSILDSLEKDVTKEHSFSQQKIEPSALIENKKIKYYFFDPNIIGKQEWINFGFSEKQAQSILNFKKSIKGFKTKDDVGRCFVIDSVKMNKLSPFIKIDTILYFTKFVENSKVIISELAIGEKKNEVESTIYVELNKADSIQLLSIKGIGPYYSNKIIDYRNRLGGYYKKEQLLEIWNFDSIRYQMVSDHIIIESDQIVKLNINQAEASELISHPYIRWGLANAIVKYRIQHGNYNSLEDVKNVIPMTDSIFKKLSPYLMVH